MNKLEVKIVNSKYQDSSLYKEIKLFIDGINLIEILKEIEKPFAEKEEHAEIAGHYSGLNIKSTKPEQFLGKSEDFGEAEEKVALLDCPCGCEGCWTFAAKISETENLIIWSNFEQVHRKGELSDVIWNYDSLGKFEFDREEYLKELEKLKT